MKTVTKADKHQVGKRKPGRPRMKEGERLTRKVFFRLTNAEWLRLHELARAAGVDYNECARQIVRVKLEQPTI